MYQFFKKTHKLFTVKIQFCHVRRGVVHNNRSELQNLDCIPSGSTYNMYTW